MPAPPVRRLAGGARTGDTRRCPGSMARESPTRSASWGSSELVSVSRATTGAARSRATRSGSSAGSSTIGDLDRGSRQRTAARRGGRRPRARVGAGPEPRPRGRSPASRARRPGKTTGEGVEFELSQHLDQRFGVGLPSRRERQVERRRHVDLDRDQLPGKPGRVGILLQRFAGPLGLHVAGPREPASSRGRRTPAAAAPRPFRRYRARRARYPSCRPPVPR